MENIRHAADDGLIFCKSRRAAERVRGSITKYIEKELKLKVNREKTECDRISGLKFLGYGFYMCNGKCRLRLHEKSEAKLRRRLRMCIWKAWKKPRTRVENLVRCGINRWRAYQWGNTSKGYWRIADSWILSRAIGDEALRRAGYSWICCYYSASALPKC